MESLVDKLVFVGISDIFNLESEIGRLSRLTEIMAIDHISNSTYTQIHQGVGVYYFCSTLLADGADVSRIEQYLETFRVGEPKRRRQIAENILEKYAYSA